MENGINKYLKMLLEQNKTEVLAIALKLKLFMFLEKKNMSLSVLVKELETDSKNTKILLESLVMIGLISKDNKDFYKNEKITKDYFLYGLDSYCGDVFMHRKEMLTNGRKAMNELVLKGDKDIAKTKIPQKWASVSKNFLKQEQKNLLSKDVVSIVKDLKNFDSMEKILDLGCSSGVLGLEIAKANKNIQAVLFDFPLVTNTALESIKEYGLENRVSVLSGNIQTDDIGSNYDLIWCSNIFYFLDNKDEVIKKIYKALKPNGILLSAHVEIGEEINEYEDSFFYFLGLNLQGRQILKPNELSNIFEETGFKSINSFKTSVFPMTNTQIHIAKK